MITLIGFELGYVTPPVALNHLLARQSIGDAEVNEKRMLKFSYLSFYYRYERWILPLIVLVPCNVDYCVSAVFLLSCLVGINKLILKH